MAKETVVKEIEYQGCKAVIKVEHHELLSYVKVAMGHGSKGFRAITSCDRENVPHVTKRLLRDLRKNFK